MKLYLVRHGETDWNKENKVLGRTDIPLNEKGIQQAEQTAEILKNKRFDSIYVSPLSRAAETGRIIVGKQQGTKEVIIEDALIEQNFGGFEGVNRSDPEYQREKRNYFSRYRDGGESFLDVSARIYPFLEELKRKHGPEEEILLVTHNGICRMITSYFENMENEEFTTFTMNNCEVKEFKL